METNTKILYLPLDERPCNYDFAPRIAEGARNIEIIRPEKEIMGNKKIPADFGKIRSFLCANASGAKALILSLDALLYGGIVPSRMHNLGTAELEKRLSAVDEIKKINPEIKIYAFALIMRCPSYSSADEEPDYYGECGREIFLTGQVKHKRELNLLSEDEADKLLSEYSKKTGGYLADFEARREKNLTLLIKILEKAGKTIDFLVIPQDDSSPYGYTTRDREKLKKVIKEKNLLSVAAYPGADEVGMTLLSRAACELENKKPKIKCVYATDSAKTLIPLYEDRELEKTLLCQIEAAGCEAADDGDITLFLNYPAHTPVEAGEAPSAGYAERDIQGFINGIQKTVNAGGLAALADGAYCNGGDIRLVKLLSKKISLFSLASYAGWNTSSNTLGTAICQAVFIYLYGKNEAQNRFLAERFYEDIGYCAHTRGYTCKNVLPHTKYNYFDAGERDGEVALAVKKETQNFINENLPEIAGRYEIDKLYMPWARMFETALSVKRKRKRGIWHRPNDTGEEKDLNGVISVLERFKTAGINLVFIESFYHGRAAYRSDLVPYNNKLERAYGGYSDYLSAFLAEAEKRGIEVHAWVEDFYIGVEENFFTRERLEWLLKTKSGGTRQSEGDGFLFLDPANAEACNYLINIYLELLERHPRIKGLNLDYIRYPLSSKDDDTGYTEAALKAFGLNPDENFEKWIDFRADKVTEFVKKVRESVGKKFPEIKFSTAVFPERKLSYETKKQDFSRWLKEGLLDFVTPMAYYDDEEKLKEALTEMIGFCRNVPCLAGLSCTYHNLPVTEVYNQMDLSLGLGAEGVVFFGSKSVLENPAYVTALRDKN